MLEGMTQSLTNRSWVVQKYRGATPILGPRRGVRGLPRRLGSAGGA